MRRSERSIPFVSDEEVVVIHQEGQPNILAKLMDLSEHGTLVYLLADSNPSGSVSLSIYHQGKVFQIPATVIRANGRLTAFEFANLPADSLREIQSKLIRMEVEWMRLSGKT
jgi:hypothetical protein